MDTRNSISFTTTCLISMATSLAAVSITTGGSHFKSCELCSTKLNTLGQPSTLALEQKSKQLRCNRSLSVCANYNEGSRGGGGDFVAGFLLGGALFGTAAYIFAPQIRRSLLNEDEHGFRRARRPIYSMKTRQMLTEKISQLNSAIDNVYSRLRHGNNVTKESFDVDSESSVM